MTGQPRSTPRPSPIPAEWADRAAPPSLRTESFAAFVPAPRVLSASELRELDRTAEDELGLPPAVLMENAALHAASIIERIDPGSVLILCGSGNNGGDGLALARQLATRGIDARAVLAGNPDKLSPCAEINANAARALGLVLDQASDPAPAETGPTSPTAPLHESIARSLAETRWHTVVDALFGTGLSRAIESPQAELVEAVNAARSEGHHRRTIALDLPSGLDADSGKPLGPTIEADMTITFAAMKQGFRAIDAQPYLGEIALVPIGVPDAHTARFGEPVSPEPRPPQRDTGRAGSRDNAPPAAGRNASQ